jgi:hypothetical protein
MKTKNTPKVVYHYTSPEGAYSILKNKTLRFTDCQYLNDRGESLYIRESLKEAVVLVAKERKLTLKDLDAYVDRIVQFETYSGTDYSNPVFYDSYVEHPDIRYYILCTSLNSDSASMWNYYVKNGDYRGYNLGFNISFLDNLKQFFNENKIGIQHGKVIYNKKDQVNIIYDKLIKEYDENIKNDPNNDAHCGICELEIIEHMRDFIGSKRLFFKNPAFESEQEYRVVLRVSDAFVSPKANGKDIFQKEFKVGSSGIITPYLEWHYTLDQKAELFTQITLSPSIEEDLAKESFKRFLNEDVQRNIQVVPSSIKLRF